jgi:hypothetical protein
MSVKNIRIDSPHLDANENIFFSRQLEHIMAQTYNVLYPEYKAMRLFPVNTEAGPGAESITYRQFDRVGMMKIISNYSDGLPRVNVKAKEFTTPVRPLGASYGYNIDEVRAAKFANKPLEMLEAEAARQAYEQAINQIAWFAYPTDNTWGGLTGILYQPNVTIDSTLMGAWGGGVTTAAQALDDMNKLVANQIVLTKGVEMPDTLLLPLSKWAYVTSTPWSSGTDTTIAEFFLKNNPSVRSIEALNELQDVAPKPSIIRAGTGNQATTTNIGIVYRRDPRKIQLHIPQPFEQFPPEQRGLEWIVATHAKCAGIITPYPLSISIAEGL